MPDMLHEISVDRPPGDVYAALTTEDGLTGWWTADVEAEPREGSTALFGFGDRSTVFEMDVAELVEDELVRWQCTGCTPEWDGTELVWELSGNLDGTNVRFTHANWQSPEGAYRVCNTTWGALMHRLKSYLERGTPDPFFHGRAE